MSKTPFKALLRWYGLILTLFCSPFFGNFSFGQDCEYAPIQITLGDLVKGERVITFVRLFPPDHEYAEGHAYQTAGSLHQAEVNTFLYLDSLIGWNLYATLYRHPTLPVADWAFPDFSENPTALVREAKVDYEKGQPLIPGLKVLAFINGCPVALIFDFREVSLSARGMPRAVASGLDMSRDKFDNLISNEINARKISDGIIVWQ